MSRGLLCATLLTASTLLADEVILTNGNRIRGIVVERSADVVTIAVGPGSVSVSASRVARIETGASDLASFRERAASLAPGDVGGWLALGRWAREHELLTQAREAFERALEADPDNAEAHAALGHVLHDGRWTSREEAYRALGYVEWEGRWITPQEREALARERAEQQAGERARIEAAARVREAEARAREAEARALRAEAEALGVQTDVYFPSYGVPLWLGGGCCVRGPGPPRAVPPRPAPRATPRPPRPPQRDGAGQGSTQGPPRRP
jgi:hypothetical protein